MITKLELMPLTFGIRLRRPKHFAVQGLVQVRFEFAEIYTSHEIAIQIYLQILQFYIRLIPW